MPELEASFEERPGRRPWSEITDEEVIAAVRLEQARSRNGVAHAGGVAMALSSPTPDEWPDGGPHALYGLGLCPRLGDGAPDARKVSPRLRKLAAAGELETVAMEHPRGKPAPPGFRVK